MPAHLPPHALMVKLCEPWRKRGDSSAHQCLIHVDKFRECAYTQPKMIISASYKTDIPAFYGQWFRNRLRAGYCRMANPFNANQIFDISLQPEDVDGFVFWTKNLGPFFDVLVDVNERGLPFIIQYTINGYPRSLESRVVHAKRSVEHFKRVSNTYGTRVAVWRYDTIVMSSETPADFHRRNFETLARSLEGTTDEVVVSFAQIYKKTLHNMNRAATEHGFTWDDPTAEAKTALLRELAEIAEAFGMALTVCSQPELVVGDIGESKCIDAKRIMDVAGKQFAARRKGSRKECGCFYARDIGDYDTCPHDCVYCYAVRNRELASRR